VQVVPMREHRPGSNDAHSNGPRRGNVCSDDPLTEPIPVVPAQPLPVMPVPVMPVPPAAARVQAAGRGRVHHVVGEEQRGDLPVCLDLPRDRLLGGGGRRRRGRSRVCCGVGGQTERRNRPWVGHHPLWAFVDHGGTGDNAGTGELLSVLLRPGNAGSNTAADHITVIREALRQLPGHRPGTRPGRKILIRIDSAGCTHELLDWIVGQRLSYSVGFTLPDSIVDELALVPDTDWQPAYDADREPRDGAWVLEVTGLLDLSGWPPGMRVIIRRCRRPPA
jgi:hypothetical protein